METTQKSLRMHIGIVGRTNVGKSSFLNMVVGQDVAITSPIAGTTTDAVEKTMELLPVGPVVFVDTAGIDDASLLAEARTNRTRKALTRIDAAVLVVEPNIWTSWEEELISIAGERHLPVIIAVNKADRCIPDEPFMAKLKAASPHVFRCSCTDSANRDLYVTLFKNLLAEAAKSYRQEPPLIADLLPAGGLVVLVIPIDLQAPRGRLIVPQVQTIREALDCDAMALAVKEREYAHALESLGKRPDLVVCDSQTVLKMVADTPPGVACTTFSILFARQKGDLQELCRGAAAIARLRGGDRVLVAEACTHHALEDDIGRVKIPRWLRQFTGLDLRIDVASGRDFPADLADYRLIIHCGACMVTRSDMLGRIDAARRAGVPITNYGVCISALQGVAKRVLSPFPAALDAYQTQQSLNETGG